jgi:hypothetical protein
LFYVNPCHSLISDEVFGFIKPDIDAHTLGITSISRLLEECGYKTVICDAPVSEAINDISKINNLSLFKRWIIDNRISRLGFSYRLDPVDAQISFGKVFHACQAGSLFFDAGGPLRGIYFAGLPKACARIKNEYRGAVEVFVGNETSVESLRKIGVPSERIPRDVLEGSAYDEMRMKFGRDIISSEEYKSVQPRNGSTYLHYGTFNDRLIYRVERARRHNEPVIRTHIGPYDSNYDSAKKELISWVKRLAQTGYLDVVSIGTSQLSQSNFGENWKDKPNGGGTPLNSAQDYRDVWNAARPMLVRTYAGTRNIRNLATIYEKSLNMAWHALSFWWFCQIDGRGPNTVLQNLKEHYEALKYIAQTGKPYEPNIPHHFAFRGSDDVSYVLSALVAAKTAKSIGVKYLILQTMLNTPRHTWGIQDIAKSRVLLRVLKEIEDSNFRVFLQPRAGLDYFSPDIDTAKCQLAAVTALMDDIQPFFDESPPIIHVVSYSEGVHLATPEVIDESIKITLQALKEYRLLRKKGTIENMDCHREAVERTENLYAEVKDILSIIEKYVKNPYTPTGLYKIFCAGFLPVPYLWQGKEEFRYATRWKTAVIKGSVKVVDDLGQLIATTERAMSAARNILGLDRNV